MSEAIFSGLLERRGLDRGDLVYYVGGEGHPLVLIHGLAGAATNWIEVVAHLASRYRLLVPDLPGHGVSARAEQAMTLADFATVVRRCGHEEGVERPVLVGHSFGGQVALQLGISDPDWSRGIVLAAASGISSGESKRRRALEMSGWLRPARRTNRLRPWILRRPALREIAFSGMVSDVARLSDGAAGEFYASAARAADTRTAVRALLSNDLRTQLHRVRAPSLVIWGARDAALPVSDGFDYARRLRAPVRVLADTGHLLIGERPGACARLIDDFVVSLPSAETG